MPSYGAEPEGFVCVFVVPLANPVGRGLFAQKVEAGIDLILAVWKEELHLAGQRERASGVESIE